MFTIRGMVGTAQSAYTSHHCSPLGSILAQAEEEFLFQSDASRSVVCDEHEFYCPFLVSCGLGETFLAS